MKKHIANTLTGCRIFGSIAAGYCLKRQFISMHTVLNKAAGLLLFLWPLTVSLAKWKLMAIVVCFIATLAALQEGGYVLTDREPGRA